MPPRPQSRTGRALRLFALFAAWLALTPSAWCKTTLDPTAIYGDIAHAQDCLSMTWNAANQNLRGQTVANCLRMAFHDAGTYQTDTDEGGANGSIMRELDFSIFTQHNGLQACAAIMEVIAVQVRTTGCPELTYADAIQVVGAAAVAASGGPMCDMLMGRPDAAVADDTSVLPSQCHDVTILIDGFTRNGFTDPATSLVVLSGAHNIGRSQVTGQSRCSRGLGPLTAAPNSFDGHYYNEVVDNTGRRGWFSSDQTLADNGAPTATLMTTFARDHGAFLDAWCPHYRESSLLGVDPVANGFRLNDGWTPDHSGNQAVIPHMTHAVMHSDLFYKNAALLHPGSSDECPVADYALKQRDSQPPARSRFRKQTDIRRGAPQERAPACGRQRARPDDQRVGEGPMKALPRLRTSEALQVANSQLPVAKGCTASWTARPLFDEKASWTRPSALRGLLFFCQLGVPKTVRQSAALPAVQTRKKCKTTLDPTAIYGDIAHAQDCLSMTWNAANQNLRGQTVANCLRMAFHDAATYQTDTDEGGANGSIMRELDFSIFTQHNGLQACAAIMEVIAVQVRTTGCPELTYADAIQVVGAAAVAASGGPMCDMLMGRPDAAVADDTSVLLSQCHDVTILIDGFTRNGFTDPATSLVVLSGAHNIGRSQVTGQSRCSRGLGPLTAAPNSFDGHYYNEVVDNTGRRGWFSSDQTLADNGAPTATLMTTFARDHGAFLDAWCPHYRESSLLGVDPVANGFSLNDGWTPDHSGNQAVIPHMTHAVMHSDLFYKNAALLHTGSSDECPVADYALKQRDSQPPARSRFRKQTDIRRGAPQERAPACGRQRARPDDQRVGEGPMKALPRLRTSEALQVANSQLPVAKGCTASWTARPLFDEKASWTRPSALRGLLFFCQLGVPKTVRQSAALPAVQTRKKCKTTLDPTAIYGDIAHAQDCLSMTWNAANQNLRGQTVANCLRMAFHDAATYQTDTDEGGANGSIMRELDFSIFTQHNGLQACAAIMEVIAVQVRTTGCPELTHADAIQVVGAAAVAASGGPMCDMLMGRPDAAVADDTSVLPSQCHDVTILIDGFTRNGFTDPATSLVVLSGAHNIGRSQVTGQSRCSRGLGPLTAAPNSFDGHYYNEVVDNTGRRGWFSSDQTLADNGAPTATLMTTFARDHGAFLDAWCPHYRESSLLGVDPVANGFSLNDGWTPDHSGNQAVIPHMTHAVMHSDLFYKNAALLHTGSSDECPVADYALKQRDSQPPARSRFRKQTDIRRGAPQERAPACGRQRARPDDQRVGEGPMKALPRLRTSEALQVANSQLPVAKGCTASWTARPLFDEKASWTRPSALRGLLFFCQLGVPKTVRQSAALPAVQTRKKCKTTLDPTAIYGDIAHAQDCLSMTWNAANQNLRGQTVANCLRMAFHDAATYQTDTDEGGANGSIMRELDFSIFTQHNGLQACAAIMEVIAVQVRTTGCPELTYADAIQVVGAAAVAASGGPMCDMLMGRPDAAVADDTSVLPSQCHDVTILIDGFTRNGFTDPATSLVVLSGAHNIGRSQVTGQSRCSRGLGPLTAAPNSFDGHYYNEVVDNTGRRGWFSSDQTLADNGAPTATLMTTFARDHGAFLDAWCPHYRESSLLGVDPVANGFSLNDGWTPETIAENMKPAQRQWFVDASCYDPESGFSVDMDSRMPILVKFFYKLGQQIWLALLPYLKIISEKVEQIRLSSNLALPTSTHSLEHSSKDRTGQAKVESVLSCKMLQPVQEDVFKAQEISEVVSKTSDQSVYRNKMLAYYRNKMLDIQARKHNQDTTADMV
eukprot:gene11847-14952_t